MHQQNRDSAQYHGTFLSLLGLARFPDQSTYNLVHWFKRLCLPNEYLYSTLDTIRTDFLVLPAKLINRGGQNVLLLPHDYHYQAEFTKALKRVEKLRLSEV